MRIANLAGRLVLVDGDRILDVEAASEGRFAADPALVFSRWDEFREWAGRRRQRASGCRVRR